MKLVDVNKMTGKELKEVAKGRSIPGYYKMRVGELREAISTLQQSEVEYDDLSESKVSSLDRLVNGVFINTLSGKYSLRGKGFKLKKVGRFEVYDAPIVLIDADSKVVKHFPDYASVEYYCKTFMKDKYWGARSLSDQIIVLKGLPGKVDPNELTDDELDKLINKYPFNGMAFEYDLED